MMNKMYLYGTKFEVMTDHEPLVSLYNRPNKSAPVRVHRHISKLRAFHFTVKYIPGTKMPCDYGSRHPEKERQHTKQER